MSLTSKTALLAFLARRNPQIWEIIHPHVPVISEGTRHVMAAMVIKSIAGEISNQETAVDLQETGRKLFSHGIKGMSYDDDGWCGTPWPHHIPVPVPDPDPWNWIFRGDEDMLNPQPLPPKSSYYGAILTLLAEAVSYRDMAGKLREIGASLIAADGPMDENTTQRTLEEEGYTG